MGMTQTAARAYCTGTDFRPFREAVTRAAELGVYPPAYGRGMCTTCDGIVLPNKDDAPRKHKVGSNLSRVRADYPAEQALRDAGLAEAAGLA